MKTTGLKIFFLLLISTSIFLFHSDNSKSCGYEYSPPFSEGLFNGDVIKEPTLSPFFFVSEPNYYGYPVSDSLLMPVNDNINEWQTFLNCSESKDDIKFLIYKSSASDIESILSAISTPHFELNYKLKSNSVIQNLIKNKSVEFLNYLLYAKRCEPSATGIRVSYWDELERDTTAMKILISDGLDNYASCSNMFLKTRYAYQVIRLTHYLKRYSQTISLYDSLITPLNSKSIIKYWALAHKAGALASIGDYSQSTYLFAKIFDECLSKRNLAAQNFYIRSSSQLLETLDLCQNDHEKTVVWFLHSYYSDDLGGLKKIYELEPASPMLEVLLTRLIEYLEKDIFLYYNNILEPNWSNDFTRLDRGQFYNFVNKCAEKQNTKRPYFWYYCAGYLSLLRHDYESMDYNFQKVKSLLPVGEEDFLERMKIIEIYRKVDEVTEITSLFESKILPDLEWLLKLEKRHSDEAFRWTMLKLADKYIQQKDSAKYFICRGQKLSKANYNYTVTPLDLKINPAIYPLEKLNHSLWGIIDKPDYMRFLTENFCYTPKEVVEMQGTVLLANYEFPKAIETLYIIKNELDFLPANPFMMNIRDCRICDKKNLKTKLYTKYTFAVKMDSLEKQLKLSKKNLAEDYFQLANAYYNISFFGNSWMVADLYRSSIQYDLSPNNLDLSKAEAYYLKAMTLSKDKEFIAKCTFMAARCEQNRFYFDKGYLTYNDDYYYDCDPKPEIKKENYKTYFQVLKDKYSKTQFYKEALKECKYFNNFVLGFKQE